MLLRIRGFCVFEFGNSAQHQLVSDLMSFFSIPSPSQDKLHWQLSITVCTCTTCQRASFNSTTDSFSWGCDPYTLACKARPSYDRCGTSLSVSLSLSLSLMLCVKLAEREAKPNRAHMACVRTIFELIWIFRFRNPSLNNSRFSCFNIAYKFTSATFETSSSQTCSEFLPATLEQCCVPCCWLWPSHSCLRSPPAIEEGYISAESEI